MENIDDIQARLVIGCQCASPVEPPLCDYCHNLPTDASDLFARVAALTAALREIQRCQGLMTALKIADAALDAARGTV